MGVKMQVISPVNSAERAKMDMRAGDTVRVWQKTKEGDKTRLQAFEGLVLARKHGTEPGATFVVRATLSGVGVEKTFPLYSPMIDKIEILRRSKVRRAKLYYIRDKATREIRKKLSQVRLAKPVKAEADEVSAEAFEEGGEAKQVE